MAITKTYTLNVSYDRDDEESLSESDLEYIELQKKIMKRVADVVPISAGIVSCHIVGTVSES